MQHIIHLSHIRWDIDEPGLPIELDVAAEEVLEPGEDVEFVGYAEITSRIADLISDRYGFCVQGFAADTDEPKNKK